MPNKQLKGKYRIDRRQFIIKSAIGVCGFSATFGMYNVALSSSPKMYGSYKDANREAVNIPAYNENALFFNPNQYATVATIAARIVPSDDEPGATEAGVVDHIDKIIADSKRKQKIYTNGLKQLDHYSQSKFGNAFVKISSIEQMEIMRFAYDRFRETSLSQRISRKLFRAWGKLTGTSLDQRFLQTIYTDTIEGFYANPVSWQQVGYFGPPNPVGYPDFADPPSSKHYTGAVRLVDNVTCNTCHEIGEHPRGGLINHTCISCHRPHQPWPYDQTAFYLEDHIGVAFSNPDRLKGVDRD
jgi:gluconate 2-dehydrogenase gamma chain